MRRILGLTNSSSANGVVGTPFFRYLTDDGTDYTLAEDYSSAATDVYWEAPKDAFLSNLTVIAGDDDITQGAVIYERFMTLSLTNGLKFGVKNGSTLVHDFTVTQPILTVTDLVAFGTGSVLGHSNTLATTTYNYAFGGINCNFRRKFGSLLFMPAGHRFVCTLQDNYSTISSFRISISGYYGG